METTAKVPKQPLERFLEILPGFTAWSILILPFALAPFIPIVVSYFILLFNLYWFLKAMNLMRHMIGGFRRMWRNMKIDFLERCKKVSTDPEKYLKSLASKYRTKPTSLDKIDYLEIDNISNNFANIKNWEDIYQIVFITNYKESFEITDPTYEAVQNSNFPNERIIIVSCGEKRDEEGYTVVASEIQKKYTGVFADIFYFMHEVEPGEAVGKGANLYSAGHKFMKEFTVKYPKLDPENALVTTLDADHIVHKEYFSILTYKYIIDPNRDRKTYQPVPLLFNNIWDAPSPSRVLAVASSFWQMIEAMRPYRLRTFASHTQSLKTLLVTDFWSNKTIVEDGHQYWRTYFAFHGDHEMVPILMPIYHDTVLAESFWGTLKNQYMQRRRWAWGISDFPFIVLNYRKHPEIPRGEKFLQTFRLFAGNISWSTASFLIAFAGIPLLFNTSFQDSVLAHQVPTFSSNMLTLAYIALIANVWIYFLLLPPLPDRHKKTKAFRYFGMVFQWFIAPIVSIFFSSLPALESQTRLMLGQSLNVFWVTPKIRISDKKK